MTQEASFHRAIVEHPEDDAVRLTYADWLEAHGQLERAEFIRVQIALAPLREDDPRRPALASRETELLKTHERDWTGPWRESVDSWVFHRGMAGVSVDVPGLLAHGEALSDSPAIVYVDVSHRGPGAAHIQALASCPHLARVTVLWMEGFYGTSGGEEIDDQQLHTLLLSPYLRRLEELHVRCNQITDAGLRAFGACSAAPPLRELALGYNAHITDAGAVELAQATALSSLEILTLEGNRIGDEGARALARSANLSRLVNLGLANNISSP